MRDVIVIGAGAAGIEAARNLQKAGLDFLVLEARRGIGGRVLAKDRHPEIELGAEFIHGRAPLTKRRLASAHLGWEALPDEFHFFDGERIRSAPGFWNFLSDAFRHLHHRHKDRPFSEFIASANLTPTERLLSTSFIEGFNAADLDRAGSNALAGLGAFFRDPAEHAMARPVGGYRPLFDAMAAPIRDHIRNGKTVTEIAWSPGSVTVRGTTDGRPEIYRARAAIVTVPIGVLKTPPGSPGAIRFIPEVPGLAKNLSRLETGEVVRIGLRFHPDVRALWERKFPRGFPFISSPDLDFMTWWGTESAGRPLITAWAGGSHAVRLAGLDRRARVECAIANLARVLSVQPSTLAHALERADHHDWSQDPFARGAYSYVGIGGENVPARLRRPVADTLFFAGEALESENSGTVEAALASGRRQARKLLRTLVGQLSRGRTSRTSISKKRSEFGGMFKIARSP